MDWISDRTKDFLCFGGMLLCVIVLIGILMALWMGARDVIDDMRWRYRYKHRFDKPPTAKCYCKDCEMHGVTNRCTLPGSSRYTPDNGYCHEAEPMTLEQAKRREKE